MRKRVLIIGHGIAALSCAKLLLTQGWDVEIWKTKSRKMPTWVLGDMTSSLLLDIWEDPADLLTDAFPLTEHAVLWGQQSTFSKIKQPSVTIDGNRLVERLSDDLSKCLPHRLHFVDQTDQTDLLLSLSSHASEFSWIIDASGRNSAISQQLGAGVRLSFGNRIVIHAEVDLHATQEERSSWLESTPDGWAFLAPLTDDKAILQVMATPTAESPAIVLTKLLEQTRYIQTRISQIADSVSVFQASPSLSPAVCGPGWIAVGDAACSFDPLCGDGTGYALRGALLATGILNGIANGLPAGDCLEHYQWRLQKTLLSHVGQCLHYYADAFSSLSWQMELGQMKNRLEEQIIHLPEKERFAFRLEGRSLIPLL